MGESSALQVDPVSLPITEKAWDKFKHETLKRGREDARNFRAGKLRDHVSFWKTLTLDPNILAMIKGIEAGVDEEIMHEIKPTPYAFERRKREKIDGEI